MSENPSGPIAEQQREWLLEDVAGIGISRNKAVKERFSENEEKFKIAFQANPCAMVISQLDDGRIIEANEAFERITGFKRQEMLDGLTTLEAGIWPDPEERKKMADIVASQGFISNYATTCRNKHGEEKTILLSANMIKHLGQEYVLSISLDITGQKRAEEKLVETSQRLELATKAAGIGIWDWEIESDRLIWDDRMRELYGYTRESFSGNISAWQNKLHPEDRDRVWAWCEAALRGEQEWDIEFRVIHTDGTVKHIKADGMVIRDSGGAPIRMLGTNHDITARKEAELRLHDLTQVLERRVLERTALAESRSKQLQSLAVELIEAEERERRRVADVLHDDLQQILAAARMQLESVCHERPEDTVLPNVLKLLSSSIEKSRRISHELSPPVLQHSDLADALRWTAQYFYKQFGMQVTLNIEASGPVEYGPLKAFLFRALQELLFNIVKHGRVQNACVDLMRQDGTLVLTVSDEGCGFEARSLDSANADKGLGLLSLRERARYIGGSLMIRSAPGRGSVLTLTVPCHIEATVKTDCPTLRQPHDASAAGHTSVKATGAARVLFVDDHKVMRQGLINLIGGHQDIQVAGEASDGKDAIDRVRQLKPDVVVMDVSMPVMDGIEATRCIKAEIPGIRVVGLSMHSDDNIRKAMFKAGADGFVSKTASTAELILAILGSDRVR